mmetsp:Transcript_7839/g.16940  ORF Transcript_7839/g.16940 Transcript_7839/m.16940 type:complete len:87 (-) Transcript_7839:223-483(-)
MKLILMMALALKLTIIVFRSAPRTMKMKILPHQNRRMMARDDHHLVMQMKNSSMQMQMLPPDEPDKAPEVGVTAATTDYQHLHLQK